MDVLDLSVKLYHNLIKPLLFFLNHIINFLNKIKDYLYLYYNKPRHVMNQFK